MPNFAEIRLALYGAWRLLVLDAKGLAYLRGDFRGALHSFWVAAILLPLAVLEGFIPEPVNADTNANMPAVAHNPYIDLAGFFLSWFLLLAITYGLVRWYGRKERFGLFVSTYNWARIPRSLADVLCLAIYSGAGHIVDLNSVQSAPPALAILGSFAVAIVIGLQVLMLAYEWFVSWTSLDSGIALPTIILLLDLVFAVSLPKISALLA